MVALFAVHSRGNKNSLALVAFPSYYLPVLQLCEKSADCNSRGPTVLRLKLVDNVKILALPHFVQCDLAALVAGYLPRHCPLSSRTSLQRPCRPASNPPTPERDRSVHLSSPVSFRLLPGAARRSHRSSSYRPPLSDYQLLGDRLMGRLVDLRPAELRHQESSGALHPYLLIVVLPDGEALCSRRDRTALPHRSPFSGS